jgi:hypothetical protein
MNDLDLLDFVRRGMLVPAVAVVAKLRIADLMGESPKRADDLAAATGAHAPTLYRLLRTLAGVGLFEEDDEGRFSLTSIGSALRHGEGARDLAVLLAAPFSWAAWGNLEHSVMTGESAFRHTHGRPLFEYLEDHSEADALFHDWMTRQSQLQIPGVLAAYDFSRFRKIIDIGGGQGGLLAAILRAHPGLTGVLYDLSDVVGEGTLAEAPDLAGRCAVVAGSFFDSVPAGADCYVLKLVIHDWDDARAARILRNVRAAVAEEGRILLLEFVIPPGNDDHQSKLMDLSMLVFTEGGRVRTEAEHRELLQAAGFSLERVIATSSPLAILEAAPA